MADENMLRKVQDHAVRRLPPSRIRTTNLHIHKEELREGTQLAAHPPRQGFKLKRNTIMVFADEPPNSTGAIPAGTFCTTPGPVNRTKKCRRSFHPG